MKTIKTTTETPSSNHTYTAPTTEILHIDIESQLCNTTGKDTGEGHDPGYGGGDTTPPRGGGAKANDFTIEDWDIWEEAQPSIQ